MSRPKYCDDMECFACAPGRLKDAEEARKPKSPWQPIETAPRDGTIVLMTSCTFANGPSTAWYSEKRGKWLFDDEFNYEFIQPTHWMLIPTLPEGER